MSGRVVKYNAEKEKINSLGFDGNRLLFFDQAANLQIKFQAAKL